MRKALAEIENGAVIYARSGNKSLRIVTGTVNVQISHWGSKTPRRPASALTKWLRMFGSRLGQENMQWLIGHYARGLTMRMPNVKPQQRAAIQARWG